MRVDPNTRPAAAEPWANPWPTGDLEEVGHCPVCCNAERRRIHAGLIDNTFYCAPGIWTMWRCAACSVAYLDPRPTPESIGQAYGSYYTHDAVAPGKEYAALGAFKRLRRRLLNGFLNHRFGARFSPASPLGTVIASFFPHLRKRYERKYRNLPPLKADGMRLLDIGCGNGAYLRLAASCGWQVEGIDPDPLAQANASRQGLTVHVGGIEHYDGQADLFDVISLSHVVEHLHDPASVLRACQRLLKPKGTIWLETPNIDSVGHSTFGPDWRGIETPRHLVLFNRASLVRALQEAGFGNIKDCVCPSACSDMFRASYALRRGQPPQTQLALPIPLRFRLWLAILLEPARPSRREFLTLAATKGC